MTVALPMLLIVTLLVGIAIGRLPWRDLYDIKPHKPTARQLRAWRKSRLVLPRAVVANRRRP